MLMLCSFDRTLKKEGFMRRHLVKDNLCAGDSAKGYKRVMLFAADSQLSCSRERESVREGPSEQAVKLHFQAISRLERSVDSLGTLLEYTCLAATPHPHK
jgi:hypothetical protein